MFQQLKWLPFDEIVKFKQVSLVYRPKAVNDNAPQYIQTMFTNIKDYSNYSLRSSANKTIFVHRTHHTSLSHTGIIIWKALAENIQSAETFTKLKKMYIQKTLEDNKYRQCSVIFDLCIGCSIYFSATILFFIFCFIYNVNIACKYPTYACCKYSFLDNCIDFILFIITLYCVFCLFECLRAPRKTGKFSLGLPSQNKDFIIIIILLIYNYGKLIHVFIERHIFNVFGLCAALNFYLGWIFFYPHSCRCHLANGDRCGNKVK